MAVVAITALVVGSAISLGGIGVNAIEASKTRKASATAAANQITAETQIASQTNSANMSIGESNDLASIINTAGTNQSNLDAIAIQDTLNAQSNANVAAITAAAPAQAASVTSQGNLLLLIGGGVVAIAIVDMINKHGEKKAAG